MKLRLDKASARYTTVGLELIIAILFGGWLGQKGDERFGTGPWLLMFGFVCGLYAGFRAIFRAGQHMRREWSEKDKGESP
jgi:F0F1-type ATP synthase assembly protein I